ncbi:hypothetical protein BGZ73_000643 [Actinomortierella ambigua]|nr:hypothetical protein BGZ73_000643 [Actinomortierella ambigua]
MFDDSDYQVVVDKINAVRRLGLNHVLSVPQIAIVGDQSTGKSSVLEAVTKLSFPRDKNTCTRFATQVTLRRDIQVTGGDRLTAHIEDEDDFNEKYHEIEVEHDTFDIVIREAVKVLCRFTQISDKVLELTLTGPTQSPLTIIDLPGYIRTTINGQEADMPEKIEAINAKYIQDPRTIILAVHPANVDLNNSTALGKAGKVDPNGERTITILTRPDEIPEGLEEDVVETVLNNRKAMKLGYLVMRNASYRELGHSWEWARDREAQFFRESSVWHRVPANLKGRESVKRFLGDLLYEHIKKEVPLLKKEIIAMEETCEQELKSMGPYIANTTAARMEFTMMATRLRDGLIELLKGHYSQSYVDAFKNSPDTAGNAAANNDKSRGRKANKALDIRFVRSSLYKLYRQIDTSLARDTNLPNQKSISVDLQRFQGSELPGFLPFRVFEQIFNQVLSEWKRTAKAGLQQTCDYFHKAITAYIEYATKDPGMRPIFLDVFDNFYRSQKKKIDEQLQEIFNDEVVPFTLNRNYSEMIHKIRQEKSSGHGQTENGLSDEEDEEDEYDSDYEYGNSAVFYTPSRGQQPQVPPQLTSSIFASTHQQQQQQQQQTNEQAAVEHLEDTLKAYCDLARRRIADILPMQTIERYLVREIDTFFAQLIGVDEKALQNMIESPRKQEVRRGLERKIDTLSKSLREL